MYVRARARTHTHTHTARAHVHASIGGRRGRAWNEQAEALAPTDAGNMLRENVCASVCDACTWAHGGRPARHGPDGEHPRRIVHREHLRCPERVSECDRRTGAGHARGRKSWASLFRTGTRTAHARIAGRASHTWTRCCGESDLNHSKMCERCVRAAACAEASARGAMAARPGRPLSLRIYYGERNQTRGQRQPRRRAAATTWSAALLLLLPHGLQCRPSLLPPLSPTEETHTLSYNTPECAKTRAQAHRRVASVLHRKEALAPFDQTLRASLNHHCAALERFVEQVRGGRHYKY